MCLLEEGCVPCTGGCWVGLGWLFNDARAQAPRPRQSPRVRFELLRSSAGRYGYNTVGVGLSADWSN